MQNPVSGAFYSVKLKDAKWLDSSHYYFEMMNYLAITSGDYDGDGKDSLIVYGCGDGEDLYLYEVEFTGTALTATKMMNLKDVLYQTPFMDDNDANRQQFVYTVMFKASASDKKDRMHTYVGISGGAVYDDKKDEDGNIISFGSCQGYASSPVRSRSGNTVDSSKSNASQLFYNVTDTYSNAVPIALDTDEDGLLARLDSMSYLYADPNVNAVLQSAPYFEEIDELGGYGDSGATSYTIETSYGYSTSSGESISIGAGLAGDGEFGIVSIGVELGYNYEYSESFEKAFEETSSATFEAQEQDVVVVSRVPVMVQSYDVWSPAKNKW
ncbi:MAG: hypothetical protein IIV99_01205, partial [Oscillospiraceae bacterium]|nr:hypothetical protein [Oscillospiraceae bacterium]